MLCTHSQASSVSTVPGGTALYRPYIPGTGSVPAVHPGGGELLAWEGGGGVGGEGRAGLTEGGGAHHLGLEAARGRGAAEPARLAHVVVHRRYLQQTPNRTALPLGLHYRDCVTRFVNLWFLSIHFMPLADMKFSVEFNGLKSNISVEFQRNIVLEYLGRISRQNLKCFSI